MIKKRAIGIFKKFLISILFLSVPCKLNAEERSITGKGLYCICKKGCIERDVALKYGGVFHRYRGIVFETNTSYQILDLKVTIVNDKKFFKIRKWGAPKIHNYILTLKFIDLGNKKINRENLELYEYYMDTNDIKTTYQCEIKTPQKIMNNLKKLKQKEEKIETQRLNLQYKKNKI